MTQEDKKLLLQDLCARIPYGLKVSYRGVIHTLLTGNDIDDCLVDGTITDDLENYKPYLRSMSSMTEEEKEYIRNKYFFEDWDSWNDLLHLHYHKINIEEISEFMDWLYAHHFDFPREINGKLTTLVDLGLAIEAPSNMYNN